MLSGFFLKKRPPCSMPETVRELENCSSAESAAQGKRFRHQDRQYVGRL